MREAPYRIEKQGAVEFPPVASLECSRHIPKHGALVRDCGHAPADRGSRDNGSTNFRSRPHSSRGRLHFQRLLAWGQET